MNVRCPSCETVYRVDPSKVPAGGVRARCTECSGVIPVPGPEKAARPDGPTGALTDPSVPPARPRFVPVEQPTLTEATRSVAPEPVRPEDDALPSPVPSAPRKPAVKVSRPMSGLQMSTHATPAARPGAARPVRPVVVPGDATQPPPVARPRAPVFRPTEGPPMAAPPIPPDAEPAAAPAPPSPRAPSVPSPPAAPVEPPDRPSAPPAEKSESQRSVQPAPAPTAEPAPTPSAGEDATRSPVNPFLSRDPRQKARRLARALVSDMIVYQPEKRQQALADGNLKEAFADEIEKSWEEFVGQVGKEMADSTPFFTDALNEILAGGQKIF